MILGNYYRLLNKIHKRGKDGGIKELRGCFRTHSNVGSLEACPPFHVFPQWNVRRKKKAELYLLLHQSATVQRAVLYAWTVLDTYGPFYEFPKTFCATILRIPEELWPDTGHWYWSLIPGDHVFLCVQSAANFIVFTGMYVFCWVPSVTSRWQERSSTWACSGWRAKQPYILATMSAPCTALIKTPWSRLIILRHTRVRKPRATNQPRQSPRHLSRYNPEPPSFTWGP